MSRDVTDGDLVRALSILPEPLFRHRDVYTVAEKLGFQRWIGQTIWTLLINKGWIVRTGTRIASTTNKFYWQRTPNTGVL